jgi:S-adenosylmethionine/arginine decarboxylase-like enzyme
MATCKVARVIDQYGLEAVGDELEDRWLGNGYEQQSLRDLADVFNKRLLESVLKQAGMTTPEEVEHTYELLAGDVSTTAHTKRKRDLEREGVEVDTLLSDFVSHQAIHTYLTDHRDVSAPTTDADPVETAERAIKQLQAKLATVTEENIERLIRKGELAGGSTEVFVNVEVFCSECQTSQPVGKFLLGEGCDCGETASTLHD